MENYYTVEQGKNGLWKVVMFMSDVVYNIDSAEKASEIANALNEAYRDGQGYAKQQMLDKISGFIFGS